MDLMEKRHPIPTAAKLLGIKSKTLWSWKGAGRIGFYAVGRRVFIGEGEIRRILEEGFTPARRKV